MATGRPGAATSRPAAVVDSEHLPQQAHLLSVRRDRHYHRLVADRRDRLHATGPGAARHSVVQVLRRPKLALHGAAAKDVASHREDATTAVYFANPRPARISSSEYVCRLWREKVSVAVPTCGGIVTTTPCAGSRPARTKQKLALVLTPVPSSSEHLISAGSVFGAGGGAGFDLGAAGVRRLCDRRTVGRPTGHHRAQTPAGSRRACRKYSNRRARAGPTSRTPTRARPRRLLPSPQPSRRRSTSPTGELTPSKRCRPGSRR